MIERSPSSRQRISDVDAARTNEGFVMNVRFIAPPRTVLSRLLLTALAASCLLLAAGTAAAQGPTGLNNAAMEAYFPFSVSENAALVSFDWDGEGALHYTVGDPNWGLKLEAYKHTDAGEIPVHQSSSVWAGSRIACIGDRMYFNDGGDFMRSDFNYYLYDPANPGSVESLLEAPYGASLWGIDSRHSGEFFASGAAAAWGPAALFFSPLTASGALASAPPILFGQIGESPGPMAFDSQGNLYYAPGYAYSGTAPLYRWSAAEVAAALADPVGAALSPSGREWAVLPAPYDGATGMATDNQGNVYVSATAWGAPSQLILFKADSGETLVAAEYGGRLETVRFRDHGVYVSCADGVFHMPLLTVEAALEEMEVRVAPGGTAVFAVNAQGGLGEREYQWHRVSANKSDEPVGDNLPSYSMTAYLDDSGAVFYCVVSDAASTVQSPQFALTVENPVPLSGATILLALALALALLGLRVMNRADRRAQEVL